MSKINFQEYLQKQGIELSESTPLTDVASGVAGYVRELVGEKVDVEAMTEARKEIKQVFDKVSGLDEALKQQGLMLAKAGEDKNEDFVSTFSKQMRAQADALKALKNGEKQARVRFDMPITKAVGSMSLAGSVTGDVPQAQRIAGISEVPLRNTRFLDVLPRAVASSNVIDWVYESGYEGTPAQTAEGAAKAQVDFEYIVGLERIEKTTAYIKITDEMLDDIPQMASKVQNNLLRRLLRAVESQTYSGNGTTPNLRGISTVATTFAAGTFALAVDEANNVDVLAVAMNQIMLAEQGIPNYIFMNPSDITALKLVKVTATDRRAVDRLVFVAGTLTFDGVPIIPTTLIPADNFLMGDFSLSTLYQKGGISVEIGYDGNDFTTNFKTIRAEWRGAVVVEHNYRSAFVKGVFSTAKAALETAP